MNPSKSTRNPVSERIENTLAETPMMPVNRGEVAELLHLLSDAQDEIERLQCELDSARYMLYNPPNRRDTEFANTDDAIKQLQTEVKNQRFQIYKLKYPDDPSDVDF